MEEATLATDRTLTTEATLCAEAGLLIEAWLWIAATISRTATLRAAATLSTDKALWTDATLSTDSLLCTEATFALKAEIMDVIDAALASPTSALLSTAPDNDVIVAVDETPVVEFPALPAPGMKPISTASPYSVLVCNGGSISDPSPESTCQMA